jgi:hypothetical protein
MPRAFHAFTVAGALLTAWLAVPQPLLATPAQSQAQAQARVMIYRCTDAGGHVALRDSPCREGQAQQVRAMVKPKDPPPAAAPAPVPVVTATAAAVPQRIVVLRAPQPMYECTTPDGERYSSDTAEGNPRWVPLWTLGWPVQADGSSNDLAITGGSVRLGAGGATIRQPLPGPAWAANAGTWIRDRCLQLPAVEACARLRDRRDEISHRFFNAQANERNVLRVERRGIEARLDADCS